MRDLYWLSDTQLAKLEPFFPKSHGKPRVDDRRVLSGIIFINRNGLRWCDAPEEYGPHKTLYSRWKRWSEKGIFSKMLLRLADQSGGTDTLNLAALSDVRDGASATVTFTSTRAVYLKNKSATALVFSNAAFPAGGVTVQASGVATFIAPVGTGCGVGTATVSGAVGAQYDIAIVGGGSVS